MKMLRIGLFWGGRSFTVSRRPPISFSRSVALTEGNTCAANVWAVSIVQGPFSVAPCQTHYSPIRNYCGRETRLHGGCAQHIVESSKGATHPQPAQQLYRSTRHVCLHVVIRDVVAFPHLSRTPAFVRVVGGTQRSAALRFLEG